MGGLVATYLEDGYDDAYPYNNSWLAFINSNPVTLRAPIWMSALITRATRATKTPRNDVKQFILETFTDDLKTSNGYDL